MGLVKKWQIEKSNTIGLLDNLVEVKDGGITTAKIADDQITDAKIAAHTTTKITVPTSKLSGTISTSQIADGAVTPVKLSFATWEKIAETTVSSDTSYVEFTGLDINADGPYVLFADILNSASADGSYFCFVNNNVYAPDYHNQVMYADGSTVAGTRIDGPVCQWLPAGDTGIAFIFITRDCGGFYRYISLTTGHDMASVQVKYYGGGMTNPVTNITSIIIKSYETNGIGADSYFVLWKVMSK